MAIIQQAEQITNVPRKHVVVPQLVLDEEIESTNDGPQAFYGFLSAFLLAVPLWTIVILTLVKLF